MFKTVLILALAFAVDVSGNTEQCGVCGGRSRAACLDATNFALCDSDMHPTRDHGRCPPGFICTDDEKVCSKEASTPCSSSCGKCTNNIFACSSATSFTLCSSDRRNSSLEYKCPEGTVCSSVKYLESQGSEICFNLSEVRSYEMDCRMPSLLLPPLTADPTAFCLKQNKAGNFLNTADYSGRTYFNCNYEGGILIGSLGLCKQQKTFNAKLGECD